MSSSARLMIKAGLRKRQEKASLSPINTIVSVSPPPIFTPLPPPPPPKRRKMQPLKKKELNDSLEPAWVFEMMATNDDVSMQPNMNYILDPIYGVVPSNFFHR